MFQVSSKGLRRNSHRHDLKRTVLLDYHLSLMEMLQVPAGSRPPRPPDSSPSFISTPTHARLLAEMMQSHLVKDMCLIGAKVHKQLPEPQQTGLHTSTELLTTELKCV